jgi:hypothetical protein
MCSIIIIALIGTSYLAVYFTRRARADLERILVPLAEMIDGNVDLDEAEIKGHWQGNLVMGRMANAAAGTVRLFQIDMIDAAGGEGWNYVYSRPRKDRPEPEIEFISDRPEIRAELSSLEESRLAPLQPNDRDWMQLEYNPEAGHIRLARPMKGRTEIPSPERFRDDLDYLVALCAENREFQERHRDTEKGVEA